MILVENPSTRSIVVAQECPTRVQRRELGKDSGAQAGAPGRRSTESFRPHLGIAYSNSIRPAAPIAAQVAELRDRPSIPLPIGHVDLVELRREYAAYRWEVIAEVTLQR